MNLAHLDMKNILIVLLPYDIMLIQLCIVMILAVATQSACILYSEAPNSYTWCYIPSMISLLVHTLRWSQG